MGIFRDPWAVIIIGLLIVVFFGTKKIPEVAKNIGQGLKEFKKAMSDVEKEADASAAKPSTPEKIEKKDDAKA
ncbi:MAG: twin-arginine translocase TatA/TatE family subunit [Chitinispirillaceae bacterium]|jgi:sec-independent protein translocase protein TatA